MQKVADWMLPIALKDVSSPWHPLMSCAKSVETVNSDLLKWITGNFGIHPVSALLSWTKAHHNKTP